MRIITVYTRYRGHPTSPGNIQNYKKTFLKERSTKEEETTMKRNLKKLKSAVILQGLMGEMSPGLMGEISLELWGDITGIWGNVSPGLTGKISSELWGDITELWGEVSPGLMGNVTRLIGEISPELWGKISPGLQGDVTGIGGNVTGIIGDINECELTDKEREKGIDIAQLVE